jgi:uncharacterized protein YmfQ (DUF2313 family)
MSLTSAEYLEQLLALAPRGSALNGEEGSNWTALLAAFADEFARFDARVAQAHEEADPRSALETLDDWERTTGLPDECSAEVETLQERRNAVVGVLRARGGQSGAYFKALAETLGYEVTITKFRPFIAGLSRCGDVLGGEPANRYYWQVTVHGPRVTLFRTGASQAGDKLGSITYAEDLECRLSKLQPAQGELIVAYQED